MMWHNLRLSWQVYTTLGSRRWNINSARLYTSLFHFFFLSLFTLILLHFFKMSVCFTISQSPKKLPQRICVVSYHSLVVRISNFLRKDPYFYRFIGHWLGHMSLPIQGHVSPPKFFLFLAKIISFVGFILLFMLEEDLYFFSLLLYTSRPLHYCLYDHLVNVWSDSLVTHQHFVIVTMQDAIKDIE